MPTCQMETCYRYPCFSSLTPEERNYQIGYITRELEQPSLLAELNTLAILYEPLLEHEFLNFLLAFWHSMGEPTSFNPAAPERMPDLKVFRQHYKETEICTYYNPLNKELEPIFKLQAGTAEQKLIDTTTPKQTSPKSGKKKWVEL